MIVAVFFGSQTFGDPRAIGAAMDELRGTADVDGRLAGKPAAVDAQEPADGALVVVHAGVACGVSAHAQTMAEWRGLKPVVIPARHLQHDRGGLVPCTCPSDGWLRADGHRHQFCRAAGRRRNAETVAYLVERRDLEGAHAVGRCFGWPDDDDDVLDMLTRLTLADIGWAKVKP